MKAQFLDETLKKEFAGYGVTASEDADTVIYCGTTSDWHGMFGSMAYMEYGKKQCLMIDAMRLSTEEILTLLKGRCNPVAEQTGQYVTPGKCA